jgi:hypothetical protein
MKGLLETHRNLAACIEFHSGIARDFFFRANAKRHGHTHGDHSTIDQDVSQHIAWHLPYVMRELYAKGKIAPVLK